MLFLFFLYSLVMSDAFAGDCIEKNIMKEKMGSDFQHFSSNAFTGNDQRDLGFCFAFAAGNSLFANFGVQISRLSLANRVLKEAPNRFVDSADGELNARLKIMSGATSIDALKAANHATLCSEQGFPSKPQTLLSSRFEGSRAGFQKAYFDLIDIKTYAEAIEKFSVRGDQLFAQSGCANSEDVQRLFGNLSLKELSQIIWASRDKSFTDLLTSIESKHCAHSNLISIPAFSIDDMDANNERFFTKANELIDLGKVPIVSLNIPHYGAHAVSLFGREMVHGQCFFILGNSWGTKGCGRNNELLNYLGGPSSLISCRDDGTFLVSESLFEELAQHLAWIK